MSSFSKSRGSADLNSVEVGSIAFSLLFGLGLALCVFSSGDVMLVVCLGLAISALVTGIALWSGAHLMIGLARACLSVTSAVAVAVVLLILAESRETTDGGIFLLLYIILAALATGIPVKYFFSKQLPAKCVGTVYYLSCVSSLVWVHVGCELSNGMGISDSTLVFMLCFLLWPVCTAVQFALVCKVCLWFPARAT